MTDKNGRPEKGFFPVIKRAADIAGSLLGILILAIPMLIIFLLVLAEGEGAPIYRQARLGKDGKEFMIYKFRTMVADAEKDGPKWAEAEDERCTRLGRRLRHTRLDELPQLFNILSGRMSFVGPRPEREYFYRKFEEYIPNYRDRMQVKPGLTGLAQVKGGYDLLPEEKIVYDMEYIEKRSLKLDVWCICKTFRLIFTHEGAR